MKIISNSVSLRTLLEKLPDFFIHLQQNRYTTIALYMASASGYSKSYRRMWLCYRT
jgi:hypothetical protein